MIDAELEIQELYREAQQLGRAAERAAIVAWLKSNVAKALVVERLFDVLPDMLSVSAEELAEYAIAALVGAIARGDHARPEPATREGEK